MNQGLAVHDASAAGLESSTPQQPSPDAGLLSDLAGVEDLTRIEEG